MGLEEFLREQPSERLMRVVTAPDEEWQTMNWCYGMSGGRCLAGHLLDLREGSFESDELGSEHIEKVTGDPSFSWTATDLCGRHEPGEIRRVASCILHERGEPIPDVSSEPVERSEALVPA